MARGPSSGSTRRRERVYYVEAAKPAVRVTGSVHSRERERPANFFLFTVAEACRALAVVERSWRFGLELAGAVAR